MESCESRVSWHRLRCREGIYPGAERSIGRIGQDTERHGNCDFVIQEVCLISPDSGNCEPAQLERVPFGTRYRGSAVG
jgi:hypothetical protein